MTVMDLNADIGEIPGNEGRALDLQILQSVTSCNIACGGHAGDETSMRATLKAAKELGVSAGAHPSYPDRQNFGRMTLNIERDALKDSLCQQVSDLKQLADEEEVSLSHLKPHGALYNDAAVNAELAQIICDVAQTFDIPCVVGLPNSAMQIAADQSGLSFQAEGFSDRRYAPDGRLTPRSQDGSVLHDEQDVLAQAKDLVCAASVTASNGERIALRIQTLCLHGDTDGAEKLSRAIRAALEQEGVQITASEQAI